MTALIGSELTAIMAKLQASAEPVPIECSCGGRRFYATAARDGAWSFDVCECLRLCPECDGVGTVADDTHENYSVYQRPCTKCGPIRSFAIWATKAHLPTCHAIDYQPRSDEQAATIARIQRWVKDYEKGAQGFCLAGGTGVGKSYAITRAIGGLAKRGVMARYVDCALLIDRIRESYARRDGLADRLKLSLARVQVLALDEFPLGFAKEWQRELFENLISRRHAAGSLTTIATTNLGHDKARKETTEAGLARVFGGGVAGERTVSRIAAAMPIATVSGPNLRKHTKLGAM